MAIIENGYGKSLAGETAEQKASRKWNNHDVAKRWREELKIAREVTQPPERAARVITANDAEIETVEKQRARQQRKFTRMLAEIVTHGRSTVTIRGPEQKGLARQRTLEGYKAILAQRKRQLLLEKLKRLEAQQFS